MRKIIILVGLLFILSSTYGQIYYTKELKADSISGLGQDTLYLNSSLSTTQEFTWHVGCFDYVSNGGAADADYIPAEAVAHPKVINGNIYAPVNIPFNQFGGIIVIDQITIYYNTNANGDDFDFALVRTDHDGTITLDEDQDDIGNGTSGAQSTTLLAADITLSDFAYHIEIDANNTDAPGDVKIYDVKFEGHLE